VQPTASYEHAPTKSRRLSGLAWTALVAIVALTSSLITLIFELWPGLRPDPRTTLGADVSVFAIDPGVTYGAYLQRLSFSPSDFDGRLAAACGQSRRCGRLKLRGEEVYVRTIVDGFKRRSISMRLSLYNAATHTRVQGASDVDVANERLSSPSDRAVVPVWLICPPDASGRYFVRVELYHRGDDVLLAVGDSTPFRTHC
jgi:hypothetical protein